MFMFLLNIKTVLEKLKRHLKTNISWIPNSVLLYFLIKKMKILNFGNIVMKIRKLEENYFKQKLSLGKIHCCC